MDDAELEDGRSRGKLNYNKSPALIRLGFRTALRCAIRGVMIGHLPVGGKAVSVELGRRARSAGCHLSWALQAPPFTS
jgi:hypothetical protein